MIEGVISRLGTRTVIGLVAAAAALVLTVPMVVQGSHSGTSSTSIACDATTIGEGGSTSCTVTVHDTTSAAGQRAQPTGSVDITSDLAAGTLGSCTLVPQDPPSPPNQNERFSTCSLTIGNLSPGQHTLTAEYAGATDDGHTWSSSSATVALTVTTGTGTIVIEKVTVTGAGSFGFAIVGDGLSQSFELETTQAGAAGLDSEEFHPAAGSYTVTETAQAGWAVQGILCSVDPEESQLSGVISNAEAGTATIILGAGETVTCRFQNVPTGSLTIIKQSGDENDSFAFNASANLGAPGNAFSITTSGGTGSRLFGELLPAMYTVTELVPAEWELTAISCAGQAASLVSIGTNSVSVQLAAGEHVVCTFDNEFVGEVEPPVAQQDEECPGPAAPAVAAAHLRAGEYFPGGPGRPNIISLVAAELGPGASFMGISKCDREAYEDAVRAFVDAEVLAQELEPGVQTRPEHAGGAAAGAQGGPPRGRGGPHQ